MKAFIFLILFAGWTMIHAQVSPNDPVYCANEYPDGPPQVCTLIYAPVCATVNVVCVTAPCPPVQETFASGCNACANDLVEYYIQGECPDDSDGEGSWNEEEWICEGEFEGCWNEEENCWAWEDDYTDGDGDGDGNGNGNGNGDGDGDGDDDNVDIVEEQ